MNFTPKCSVSHCVSILYDCLFLGPPQSHDCYSALLAFHVIGEDRVNIAVDLPSRFPHLDEELKTVPLSSVRNEVKPLNYYFAACSANPQLQLTSQSSNRVNILWSCLFLKNPPFHRPYSIFRLLLLIVTHL